MISTKIICNDLIKRFSESQVLTMQLVDEYNNLMGMEEVIFKVNGVEYRKFTDDNGRASLNINLPVGTYTCTITFNTVHVFTGSSKTVNITVVERYPTRIISEDLTKNRSEPGKVTAQVLLYNGEPVRNRGILFRVNGVTYTRTTDKDGVAGLNINLPRGNYLCEIFNPYDDYYEYSSTSVMVNVISSTFMDGTNINKMEDETAVYQCAVYDELGRVQCNVSITVNGVTYTRHTEEDGLAKLNIRLPAGEYDIIAEFHGDSAHTGSKVVNHISSKPYMEELTRNINGAWVPGDNTGFMESHIQVKQWSPEAVEKQGGVVFWDDIGQKFHKDIGFTSYEITETDPRVKTAKFTTSEYFDLTDGQLWVHISSPYHENFGGRILKVEFDKDNGLYTYQCQDGRRNYMNKFKYVTNAGSGTVWSGLMGLLMTPLLPDYPNVSVEDMDRLSNHKICSGLRPLESYDLQSGVLKRNAFTESPDENLSYDSAMDKIMNYAHYGDTPTDVYFSPEGVCQIEPLDIHTWIKTGFKLTHSDLTGYKYGFDTTNILTGVNFQTPDDTPIINSDTGLTINEELSKLGFYFGASIGMVSPVTESVTTTTTGTGTSTGSSGVNNKGKTVVVAADINNGSDGAFLGSVCSKLESAGYSVINLGIGPGYFSSYDYSSSAQGKVGVYIMAASTVSVADAMSHNGFDYLVFGIRGDIEGSRAVSGWDSVTWGQDSDCTSVCDAWSGNTAQQISDKMGDRGCLVPGSTAEEMANAVLAAVNGESVSGGTTSTTTTVQQINVAETYKKAQEEVVKQGRNLLSFEVKLPLNHTMFKDLHTNQMFFTELPRDFKLGNLAELFKILPTYKINRGLGTEYQENRWYIEKQVIKCDSNGLFSTLTLNVLPSPYSVYTANLRSYNDAYNQAFKQQENANGNNGTSAGGGLRWSTGVAELDSLISNAISGKDNDWDKARAIHNGLRDAGIMYSYYYDFNYSNTAQRWNAKDGPGLNCGDTAALTAEAMKAGGLDAYVSLCPGHYITIINLYDEYAVSDLTWSSGNYSQREFNTSYGDMRCRNPYDYPY